MTSPWVISLATGETEALDPAKVTPGMGGFLVFFLLALVSWALYRSLATHMRRVDVRARRDAEAQAGPPAAVEPSGPQEQGARQDSGPVARTEPEDVPGEVR